MDALGRAGVHPRLLSPVFEGTKALALCKGRIRAEDKRCVVSGDLGHTVDWLILISGPFLSGPGGAQEIVIAWGEGII
jgi:hypothetical protein